VSPVKYELGFYITEDDILHSHHRDNIESYVEGCRLNSVSCSCSPFRPLCNASGNSSMHREVNCIQCNNACVVDAVKSHDVRKSNVTS
jgi:hypothetical protein